MDARLRGTRNKSSAATNAQVSPAQNETFTGFAPSSEAI
jgi:hypothetical protein